MTNIMTRNIDSERFGSSEMYSLTKDCNYLSTLDSMSSKIWDPTISAVPWAIENEPLWINETNGVGFHQQTVPPDSDPLSLFSLQSMQFSSMQYNKQPVNPDAVSSYESIRSSRSTRSGGTSYLSQHSMDTSVDNMSVSSIPSSVGSPLQPMARPRQPQPCQHSGGYHKPQHLQRKKHLPPHQKNVPKRCNFIDKAQNNIHSNKPITTVMWRNIPNRYSQQLLVNELVKLGYDGTYDFLYLPIDFQKKCNVGYAFINFLEEKDCAHFQVVMRDYRFYHFNSPKRGSCSPAHVQGLEANIQHYSSTLVVGNDDPSQRPSVFRNGKMISVRQAEAEETNAWEGAPRSSKELPWVLQDNLKAVSHD